MDTLTSVILSVKPIYAQAIMSGKKKVEFRKKIFKRPVDKVFIYSSSPVKKIIGFFTISEIIEDTPESLWEQFNQIGCISQKDFFEYYKNSEIGYSIKIHSFAKFKRGLNPSDYIDKFCAPQSYVYLEEKTASNIEYA